MDRSGSHVPDGLTEGIRRIALAGCQSKAKRQSVLFLNQDEQAFPHIQLRPKNEELCRHHHHGFSSTGMLRHLSPFLWCQKISAIVSGCHGAAIYPAGEPPHSGVPRSPISRPKKNPVPSPSSILTICEEIQYLTGHSHGLSEHLRLCEP